MPNDHGVRVFTREDYSDRFCVELVGEAVIATFYSQNNADLYAEAIRKAIEDARVEALDNLLKYGCHTAACDHLMSDPNGCSCGWKDLRAQLKERDDE